MVTTSQPGLQNLFNLYLIILTGITIIVLAAMAYALIKYRDRPDHPHKINPKPPDSREGLKPELLLALVLSTLLITLSLGTHDRINLITNPVGEDQIVIGVEGRRFTWTFTYPEGFKSQRELVVPVGGKIVLHVTSVDVVHNYQIPDFRIKADAIPGKINTIWFTPTKTGIYQSQCAELCGTFHALMTAEIRVVEEEEYEEWKSKKMAEINAN